MFKLINLCLENIYLEIIEKITWDFIKFCLMVYNIDIKIILKQQKIC